MPTMSPDWMDSGRICSRDSSMRIGSPAIGGVAAARTKSQRGVITAVPKELSLGFTRRTLKNPTLPRAERGGFTEYWTLEQSAPSCGLGIECRPGKFLPGYGVIIEGGG